MAKRLDDPNHRRPTFSARDDRDERIELTVTDDQGATATDKAKLKVRSVDPIGPFELTQGDELDLTVTWTDPGPRDTHILEIDWGDGKTDSTHLMRTAAPPRRPIPTPSQAPTPSPMTMRAPVLRVPM
jgi:hypothetical protein